MDACTVLSACPLFAGLNPASVARLAAAAHAVRLGAGERLFAAGDAPDLLYIVATGRLRATFPDGRIAGDIARLEPIGEIGLLTGDARSASVHALRSSLLFAFSADAFHTFAMAEPAALMAVTRVIISRMREPDRETRLRAARKVRTLAVLPASPGADAGRFARALEAAIDGHTKYVDYALTRHEAGDGEARWHEWLCQQEFAHKQVVFDASGPAAWTQTALRQADRVLVVMDAEQAAPDPEAVARLRAARLQAQVALVVLRHSDRMPTRLGDWKAALCGESHFYVRPDHDPDLASLGRQLTGFGVGLVLGGGGARGFAHVGLLRALAECRIPVDVCGGASMGAFVAALHASGRDLAAITDTLRDTFIGRHLLNDYRLPTVSLIAGKKFRRHLHALFGDVRIEHLPTPFYCVSTNLTHARSEVHHEGVLADWLATSMCIPGLAPPVGYQGGLLCDGAVINSLPTDVMQALGRGVIIASDVSTDGAIHAPQAQGPDPDFEAVYRPREDGGRVRIKDILFRTTSLSAESGTTYRAQRADLYLRMPVREVGTFDWRQLDAIIERGYAHAMQALPALANKLVSE